MVNGLTQQQARARQPRQRSTALRRQQAQLRGIVEKQKQTQETIDTLRDVEEKKIEGAKKDPVTNLAIKIIERIATGKSPTGQFFEAQEQGILKQVQDKINELSTDPVIKEALDVGRGVRISIKEAGVENIEQLQEQLARKGLVEKELITMPTAKEDLPEDLQIGFASEEDIGGSTLPPEAPPKVISKAKFFDIGIGAKFKGFGQDIFEGGKSGVKGIIDVGGAALGFLPTLGAEVGKELEKIEIEEKVTGISKQFPKPSFGTISDFAPSFDKAITPLTTNLASVEAEILKSETIIKDLEKAVQELPIGGQVFGLGGGVFGGEIELILEQQNKILELEGRREAFKFDDKNRGRFDKNIDNKRKDVQNRINTGVITFEEGTIELNDFVVATEKQYNKEAESSINKVLIPKQKEVQKELDKLSSQSELKTTVATLGLSFLAGAGVGTAITFSRSLGVGVSLVGGGILVSEIPRVGGAVAEGDFLPLATAGVSLAGFGFGARAGTRFGAKIGGKNIGISNIEAVIDRASLQSKVIGKNLNTLTKVKLSKVFESEIKTLVDKGFNVALIESKLVARTTKDAKLLPDVRSLFIEVTRRDGSIVERIGLGKILSTQKGKTFVRDVITRAEGKIDSEGLTIFTRSEIFQPTKKGLKKVGEVKTLEEAVVREVIKKPKEFKTESIIDVESGLVGAEIFGDTLGARLKVAKKVAKPKARAEVRIEETFTDIFLEVADIKKPIAKGLDVKVGQVGRIRTLGDIFGGVISEPIISAKLTKAELKLAKSDKIRIRRQEQIRAKEIKDFNKQLDTISSLEVLTPKQLKLKETPIQKQIRIQQEKLAGFVSVPEVAIKTAVKGVVKPRVKVKPKVIQVPLDILDFSGVQDFSNISDQFSKQVSDLSMVKDLSKFKEQKGLSNVGQLEGLSQFNKNLQKLNQVQNLDLQLKSGFDFGIVPPSTTIPKITRIREEEKKKPKKIIKKDLELVDLFIKTKGRKKKVADNILLSEGLDMGSQIADNVLSAEFSFDRNQKGARKKPPFQPQPNYWDFNQNKFRDFRQIKGKKVQLKDTYIEKRNRRLDTSGEVGDITALKFIKAKQQKSQDLQQFNKGFNNIFGGFGSPQPKKKKRRIKKKR